MKNCIKRIIGLALVLCLSFALVSCSAMGKYVFTVEVGELKTETILELKSDNKFTIISKTGDNQIVLQEGTYKIDGEELKITNGLNIEFKGTIKGDKITIIGMTFTKSSMF